MSRLFLGIGIDIHLLYACGHAKWLQFCPTPCEPMDSVACQVPLFMGFSKQEYWNGLPCPISKDLPNPGTHTSITREDSTVEYKLALEDQMPLWNWHWTEGMSGNRYDDCEKKEMYSGNQQF